MKKISLLLVVLLAAGSAGLYGQMAINTEFKISGDATATLGYDLDDRQLGFKNAFNSNISLALVPEASSSKSGDGSGWVGMIELNKFQIVIDPENANLVNDAKDPGDEKDPLDPSTDSPDRDGRDRFHALLVTEPEIVAKLVNGPLSFKFHNAPGNVAGKVEAVEDDKVAKNDYAAEDEDKDLHHDKAGAGVAFGYNTDDLGITLGITSDAAYDAEGKGDWHISGDVSVNVGPATLELQVVQRIDGNPEDDDDVRDAAAGKGDTGVAAKISGDIGDLNLSAAVDVELFGDDDVDTPDVNESLNWEAGLGVGFGLTDSTDFNAEFIFSTLGTVASDIKVTLTDKGGLVEGLNLGLTWGLFDIAKGAKDDPLVDTDNTMNNKMDMLLIADVGYGLSGLGGTLTPGAKVTVNQIDGADANVDVEFKLVLTEAIPMAELGLMWKTDSLFGAGNDNVDDLGTLTAWTKVAY